MRLRRLCERQIKEPIYDLCLPTRRFAYDESIFLVTNLVNFNVSHIIIVESLSTGEFRTGHRLYDYLTSLNVASTNKESQVECVFHDTKSAEQLRRLIENLAIETLKKNIRPLLQIECHGLSDLSGIQLRDGSSMTWPDVASLLRPLNIASRFNLFVVFATCFGALHLGELKPNQPSPCFGMIGPTHQVLPDELLKSFQDFYRQLLLTKSIDEAKGSLLMLSEGKFVLASTIDWFRRVMRDYAKSYCTKEAMLSRVRETSHKAAQDIHPKLVLNIPPLYVSYAHLNELNFSAFDEYFEKCFCMHEIPENRERFAGIREMLRKEYHKTLKGESS
jgi:hypothetical protein